MRKPGNGLGELGFRSPRLTLAVITAKGVFSTIEMAVNLLIVSSPFPPKRAHSSVATGATIQNMF